MDRFIASIFIFFKFLLSFIIDSRSGSGVVSSKELPTSKWRRDRRIRFYSEYSHSANGGNSATVKPLSESNSVGGLSNNMTTTSNPSSPSSSSTATTSNNGHIDSMIISATDSVPLDMTVISPSVPRNPPPPYREPLPGSTFANALARPSVITQAPKREAVRMSVDANQENKDQTTIGKFSGYSENDILKLTFQNNYYRIDD